MTANIRHFVSLTDHRYLPKARALHASLLAHHNSFILWLICTTTEAEERVAALADDTLRAIPLAMIEARYPQLLVAKRNRSMVEYCYTLSSAVSRWALEAIEHCDMVTYLDADLLFFDSPERVFEALGEGSIGITPHRPSFFLRRTRRGGEYNVGWITFRNDMDGNACSAWWFDRCVEWCYQRYENGKYADQGYLDSFPLLFDNVRVLDDPGFNLAPWNLANYRIEAHDGRVLVDGHPLVFFHYADFVQLSKWHYSANTAAALIWLTPKLRRLLFRPYIMMLRSICPEGLPKGLRRKRATHFLDIRATKGMMKTIRNVVFMQYIFVFRTNIL